MNRLKALLLSFRKFCIDYQAEFTFASVVLGVLAFIMTYMGPRPPVVTESPAPAKSVELVTKPDTVVVERRDTILLAPVDTVEIVPIDSLADKPEG